MIGHRAEPRLSTTPTPPDLVASRSFRVTDGEQVEEGRQVASCARAESLLPPAARYASPERIVAVCDADTDW